jgi:hypothetical protein
VFEEEATMLARFQRSFLACAFLFGICCTSYAADAPAKKSATRISDVSLSEGGRLEGQVVDYQGNVVPNVSVILRADGVEPISTTTTDEGRFAYDGVPGGVYQVVAKNGKASTIRAWTQDAAPPNAKEEAILYVEPIEDPQPLPPSYQNPPAYRGNMRPQVGPVKRILSNPIVLPAAIATAIALPIALNSHSTPASP